MSNAQSKVNTVTINDLDDDEPVPVLVTPAPPITKTAKRYDILLEENTDIPPVGLFIQVNGKSYLLKAGIKVSVPKEVIGVLNDAMTEVPVTDPNTQRVIGYRERLRFSYRSL